MRWIAVLRLRVRTLLRPGRVERELDEELRDHLAHLTEQYSAAGMTPREARFAALRDMGGLDQAKEACRDARGLRLLDELRGDLRYTGRQLRRSPAFATVAVLSLALGIGATTAILSLMEAALWEPLRVRDPQQLRLFTWTADPRGIPESTWDDWNRVRPNLSEKLGASFSYAVFRAFERDARAFTRVFAWKPLGRVTAQVGDQAELVAADLVSGGFYEGLGVVPILGRPIGPSDDRAGRPESVAVISHGFWARRFGRDPGVVGRSIRVSQVPVTIVGVNPPGFAGLSSQASPDLFLPLTMQPAVMPWRFAKDENLLEDPSYWWVDVMGRLRPGVTDAQAQAAMDDALQRAVCATLPDERDRPRPRLRLLPGARGLDNLAEDFARPLVLLLSLVGGGLLIACANVANLLLARGETRRRELSLRRALGAGRGRLARQLLTEGLVLGVAGGTIGVLLGYLARDVIPSLLLPAWRLERLGAVFDLRVLALALAVTMATSVLFSVLPIRQALRVDLQSSLRDGGRSMRSGGHPVRGRPLVVFQVSLSVLLLIGAALFLRTIANLRSVELGFRPEQVVLFTVDPPRTKYVAGARTALFERIDRRIASIPGVQASSLSQGVLVGGDRYRTSIEIVGGTPGERVGTFVNTVGDRFFATMGVPIVMGRSFDARDRPASPKVAIVNRRFVLDYLAEGNPIGRRFKSGQDTFEVVGVCGDTPYDRLRSAAPPTWFKVLAQAEETGAMTFEVRTAASAASILPRIREAVRAVDADLPVFDVRTQVQQIDSTLSHERLFVMLTSALGVLTGFLASVGIYGILAQDVARRTGEIGIRLALGALRADVLVMVVREASLLTVIGVLIGTAAALGLGRHVRSLLFGVTPADPIAISGAIAAMLIVALVAAWVPARRACGLDPVAALRHE
jgi:predicted permease